MRFSLLFNTAAIIAAVTDGKHYEAFLVTGTLWIAIYELEKLNAK